MITIVDYSVNNLRSVQKAFEYLGHATLVTADPAQISTARKLVLPGVGAYGEAMKNLRAKGLVEPLQEAVQRGIPVLGVCLGMQLLFESSEELGDHQGLGLIAGKVIKFADSPGLKVPHMGWSSLSFPRPSRLYEGLQAGDMTYFVHSYHVVPRDESVVAATGYHGSAFVAGVERGHVMGAQFHPEKSSKTGLKILDNFGKI